MSESTAEQTSKNGKLSAGAAGEILVAAPWVDELEELSSDSLVDDGGTLVMDSPFRREKADAAKADAAKAEAAPKSAPGKPSDEERRRRDQALLALSATAPAAGLRSRSTDDVVAAAKDAPSASASLSDASPRERARDDADGAAKKDDAPSDDAAVEARSEPAADRTMRLSRDEVFKKGAGVDVKIPPAPTTSPVLAEAASGPRPTTERTRPAEDAPPRGSTVMSISPVALDATLAAGSAFAQPSAASFDAPYEAPPRAQPSPVLGFTIGAVGVAVVLAVAGVIAAVAVTGGSSAAAATAAEASELAPAARPGEVKAAGSVAIDSAPATATSIDRRTTLPASAASPSDLPSEIDVSSLPAAAGATGRSAAPAFGGGSSDAPSAARGQTAARGAPAPSSPAREPRDDREPRDARDQRDQRDQRDPRPAPAAPAPAAPAPAPAAAHGSTGVIRVPISDSILTIVVDGSYRRVRDGAVAVQCGPHMVRIGTGMRQDVNVPCGGSVFVQ